MVVKAAMKAKRVTSPIAMKAKRLVRPIGRKKLRVAFVQNLRQQEQRRRGAKVSGGQKEASSEQAMIPWQQRAGAPLVPTKVSPTNWKTRVGKQVFVDFARSPWLPDDCGQGVKMTNPIARSKVGSGGTYTVFVTSDGSVFYHKHDLEAYLGKTFDKRDGFNGTVRKHMSQTRLTPESAFFNLLSASEKRCLPKANDIHFCVISARRTQTPQGVADIAGVVAAFRSQGVEPTWYVDAESLADYRRIGLRAVVGGKLTPARNKALRDANKLKKACVQCSDDISQWRYHHGPTAKSRSDDDSNAAYAKAQCHVVSPLAAARFMLAKLRGSAAKGARPRLAGVFPVSSCARGFGGGEFSSSNFILGDFFVADMSPVLFDESMTLKEDYDFTCGHIKRHGSAIRCNRLTVMAKHQTNAGGACSVRDAKGVAEQRNIAILRRKWPGVFSNNPMRKHEVVMRWKEDVDELSVQARGGAVIKKAKAAVKGLPTAAILLRTGKVSGSQQIAERCRRVAGLSIGKALSLPPRAGPEGRYRPADLRYDIMRGFLKVGRTGKA